MSPPPDFLAREDVPRYFPVTFDALAKLGQRSDGPPFAIVGRKAVYRSRDVAAWLDRRIDAATGRPSAVCATAPAPVPLPADATARVSGRVRGRPRKPVVGRGGGQGRASTPTP